MAKFNHLKVPEGWEHYWTKYPNGYTMLEALVEWVSQVDAMTDNVNRWNVYLDDFVLTFDANLQDKVENILIDWIESGFLLELIRQLINEEVVEARGGFENLRERLEANDLQVVDLKTRLDNIIVTPGDGSTPPELIDMRVVNGREYDLAGNATRAIANGDLSSDSVTIDHADFIEMRGTNILDSTRVITGGNYNENNIWEATEVTFETGMLRVTPGDVIRFKNADPNGLYFPTKYYDINGTFISGFTNHTAGGETNQTVVPAGGDIAYVSIGAYARMLPFTITKNSPYPDAYVPFDNVPVFDEYMYNAVKNVQVTSTDTIQIDKSNNLIDPSQVSQGGFINATNVWQPGSNTQESDLIAIESDDTFAVKNYTDSGRYFPTKYYDEVGTFLGATNARTGPFEVTYFTSPYPTATTFRISGYLDNPFMVTKNMFYPTEFETYYVDLRVAPELVDYLNISTGGGNTTPNDIMAAYILDKGNAVLLGDSNTAGQGTTGYEPNGEPIGSSSVLTAPNATSWSNRLMDTINNFDSGYNMRNWGISGWSAKSFVAQGIDNFIFPTDNLAIIMLGTNDRTTQIADFEANLNSILDYCESIGVPYILMDSIPAKLTNDQDAVYTFSTYTLSKLIKKIASERHTTPITNYDHFMSYDEEHGNFETDLYTDDLHMNTFGSYTYLHRNIIESLGITYGREGVNK